MAVTLNGTTGLVFNDGSSQNTAATGFGFKNRIINGAMVIDQRNAGASVTPSADTYLLDRWGYSASQTSKFTFQQNKGSVTLPVGFANYLGASVASAVTVGASDYFALYTKIEGLNSADLAWGTASASAVTLSFRVYSSLTGTFGGTICNSTNNRCYPFTYSVPVANTWTTISLTIAGDTSGTWLTTNGTGINVQFGLGVGSTYSGTAGSWSGTQYISATGAVSVVATAGATFYITGVQLEKGSTATSFDYRPYGTELALCQRYYIKLKGTSVFSIYGTGFADSSSSARVQINTPIMRASPTFASSGSFLDGLGNSLTSLGSALYTDNTASIAIAKTGGTWAAAYAVAIQNSNSTAPYLEFSSEL